jgi:hypothetical protein
MIGMDKDKDEQYYLLMLNALAGIEDDLGANQAPKEAINYVRQALDICRRDFTAKFPQPS